MSMVVTIGCSSQFVSSVDTTDPAMPMATASSRIQMVLLAQCLDGAKYWIPWTLLSSQNVWTVSSFLGSTFILLSTICS